MALSVPSVKLSIVTMSSQTATTVPLQKVSSIFPPSTGGAERMAADMGVTYLGDIQLDPRLGQSCDSGKSFIQDYPDSNVSESYKKIITSKYQLN